ncbi:hypothetical protein EV361DRAFT_758512, partial [Lentinula raphanica]
RLPIEILTEIFLHCLPTTYDIPPSSLATQAPLSLTAVCREWRTVAVNTPRLWTLLPVRVPPPMYMDSMVNTKRLLDGMEMWIKRSGSTLPLSLS